MLVLQEIEGDGQGVEVEGVAVVDEKAVVDALVHLEAHLDGGELGAAGCDVGGAVAKVEHERDAVHDILLRGAVDEGDDDGEGVVGMGDGERGGAVADGGGEEPHGIVGRGAPGEAVDVAEALDVGEDGVDVLMVGGIDKYLAMSEELQFFGHLLLAGEEVLVVGLAHIGEDAYGGLDNLLQARHLASLGDTGLEDGHLVARLHLPYREGDADLRVVALGTGDKPTVGREELDNPVLDDGLAVAARDAHHGVGELRTMVRGEALEGGEDVVDTPDIGLGEVEVAVGGYHELAHARLVEAVDVTATAVALGGNGKEEGAMGRNEGAAVGEQVQYGVVGTAQEGLDGTNDIGDFGSFHFSWGICLMMEWPMRQLRHRRLRH